MLEMMTMSMQQARMTRLPAMVVAAAVVVSCDSGVDLGTLPAQDAASSVAGRVSRDAGDVDAGSVEGGVGLPVLFVPNEGRFDPEVLFAAKAGAHAVFMTGREGVVLFRGGPRDGLEPGPGRVPVLRFRWSAARAVDPVGLDERATRVSWFVGRDPDGWAVDLPTYGVLRYEGIAPGVDLDVRPGRDSIGLRWHLAPGASLENVGLSLFGATGREEPLEVTADGGLRFAAGGRLVTLSAPVARDTGAGRRAAGPAVAFTVSRGRVAVRGSGGGERRRTLTVATTLTFSTVLGGSADDSATAVAVDRDGSIVVAGQTWSPDFPPANGYDSSFNGANTDGYIMKLDPAGVEVQYATFLGGSTGGSSGYVGWDMIRDIALDADGSVCAVGYTYATDYPTTPGAYRRSFSGGYTDIVVSKLSASGDELVFSTYLGGSDNEAGEGVALDAEGRATVAGYTYSTDFPATPGAFQTTNRGYADVVVVRFSADGSGLEYATFAGGSAGSSGGWGDYGKAVAVDDLGRAYVAGHTLSTDFPVTSNAAQWSRADSYDGFLIVVAPEGDALVYSTYFGGTGMDTVSGLALDDGGVAHIVGSTTSADFPVTAGAVQGASGGGYDAFLVRLDPTVSGAAGMVFSSYLGGSGTDQARSVSTDAAGDSFLTGSTASSDFPVTGDAAQSTFAGGDSDAFVARIGASGALSYGSLLGGSGYDNGVALALDTGGGVVIAGTTQSADFLVTQPGIQTAPAQTSNTDVFLARFGRDLTPVMVSAF